MNDTTKIVITNTLQKLLNKLPQELTNKELKTVMRHLGTLENPTRQEYEQMKNCHLVWSQRNETYTGDELLDEALFFKWDFSVAVDEANAAVAHAMNLTLEMQETHQKAIQDQAATRTDLPNGQTVHAVSDYKIAVKFYEDMSEKHTEVAAAMKVAAAKSRRVDRLMARLEELNKELEAAGHEPLRFFTGDDGSLADETEDRTVASLKRHLEERKVAANV